MTTRRENARAYGILVADQIRAKGVIYKWGGQDIMDGLDCSGFVVEWLRKIAEKFPEIYDGEDRSAAGLYNYYLQDADGRSPGTRVPKFVEPGFLIVYHGHNSKIYHVAIHICSLPDGTNIAIESGGAGSGATSDAAALARSAGIRFTDSFKHGSASWVAVDPFLLVSDD